MMRLAKSKKGPRERPTRKLSAKATISRSRVG